MYRIIGADGKEYGPVTAEVLKQWIVQGRANAATKVLLEGTTEWRDLASIPEFGSLPGAAPIGALPPSGEGRSSTEGPGEFHGTAVAEAMAREAISNDYRFDISRCFSRAWDLLMANFWFSVGAAALVLLLTLASSAIPFASLLLLYVLLGGLDWFYLNMLRGKPVELADIFAGFSIAFIPLMLFSLVSQLLTSIGFILCILPGIYLTVAWIPFTALLIMDKKLEFWPAMELSRKVISHHWWHMFGLLLLCFLANLAGTALLCVGFLFTFPLTTIVTVVAYEEVFSRVNPSQPGLLAAPPGTPGTPSAPDTPNPSDAGTSTPPAAA